jgi:hypothetical protein
MLGGTKPLLRVLALAMVWRVAVAMGPDTVAAASADPLPRANDEILLTVKGAITEKNGDGGAFFDLAMLKQLPAEQLTTETPWTEGPHVFTGVALDALMARVGAGGSSVTADALNDYSAEIPIEDGAKNGALVAYLLDGKPMLPSDRGPLWIVYPFSARPELRTETYYVRSIWNLFELTVH